MTNLAGWVSFKELVDSLMLAWGDSADQGQTMRYLNFAIKGYEDLRLHHLPATKPVLLPISTEMRVVVLPYDFLKFVSVGVTNGGVFYAFRPKSNMPASVTSDCGIDTRDVPDGTTPEGTVIQYYSGYYSLDLENNRVIIEAPLALTQVTLNYTPTGVARDGQTYIPRMCRMVVEAYVEHQLALRDKNKDAMTFEREYIKALNKFRGLQYNVDELFGEYYQHIATSKQY